jgi:hypothetical protein
MHDNIGAVYLLRGELLSTKFKGALGSAVSATPSRVAS